VIVFASAASNHSAVDNMLGFQTLSFQVIAGDTFQLIASSSRD